MSYYWRIHLASWDNTMVRWNWEEMLVAFRRVRAVQAVDELQKQSVESGLDKMNLEEINREIQAVRKSTHYDVMASR